MATDVYHSQMINSSPLDRMTAIPQTIFSDAFLWMESFEVFFKKISLTLIPKGPIDKKSALFQVMAWRRTHGKPLTESVLTQFTDPYMRH